MTPALQNNIDAGVPDVLEQEGAEITEQSPLLPPIQQFTESTSNVILVDFTSGALPEHTACT